MQESTNTDISEDLTEISIPNLTNFNLNYAETKEKENIKNKTSEEINFKEKGNHDFGSAIRNYFGSYPPTIFLTLTFRDKRIVNGINIGNRIELEKENEGYIPLDSQYMLEKDHSENVGVQRTSKAINDFFYIGMYNNKYIKNHKTANLTNPKWKIVRSVPLTELAEKFVYVVELGKQGQRRHIHSLVRLRTSDDNNLNNLYRGSFKKNLFLWQKHQGFYDIKTNFDNDDKYSYISKQQYIAKSFDDNQYDNYTELFGSYDIHKKLNDLRNAWV